MNQASTPQNGLAPKWKLGVVLLGLVACLTLGFILGRSLPTSSQKYAPEWEQLRNEAHNKLVSAPGYKDHAAVLETLLEKRHTEMRNTIHDRPNAKAYLASLFLFMSEDAKAIPDPGAEAVLDNIANEMLRQHPSTEH
jgi:hypothetical protein